MTLNEAESKYIFNDGQIISCSINFIGETLVVLILKVREKIGGKLLEVLVELKFKNLSEFNLFEKFDTEYYSDLTLVQLESGEYYLSLDPFVNTNESNENDNFIVKAKSLEISRV